MGFKMIGSLSLLIALAGTVLAQDGGGSLGIRVDPDKTKIQTEAEAEAEAARQAEAAKTKLPVEQPAEPKQDQPAPETETTPQTPTEQPTTPAPAAQPQPEQPTTPAPRPKLRAFPFGDLVRYSIEDQPGKAKVVTLTTELLEEGDARAIGLRVTVSGNFSWARRQPVLTLPWVAQTDKEREDLDPNGVGFNKALFIRDPHTHVETLIIRLVFRDQALLDAVMPEDENGHLSPIPLRMGVAVDQPPAATPTESSDLPAATPARPQQERLDGAKSGEVTEPSASK